MISRGALHANTRCDARPDADQLDHWGTEELRGFGQIIALSAAAGILLERKGLSHYKVDHPQAHKRFHFSEPYPLISKLKEVLQ